MGRKPIKIWGWDGNALQFGVEGVMDISVQKLNLTTRH